MGSGVSLVALSSPSLSNAEESNSIVSAGRIFFISHFFPQAHPLLLLTFCANPQVSLNTDSPIFVWARFPYSCMTIYENKRIETLIGVFACQFWRIPIMPMRFEATLHSNIAY
jgi:hypothetical protein